MKINGILAAMIMASAVATGSAADNAEPQDGYLFVYFTGNAKPDESIHYALAGNDLRFRALNDNNPIVDSRLISETGGVRDPHILRRHDGKGFLMVVTDMVSHLGWDSNRGMVLMKSPDLVNWTSTPINIQKRYKGHEDLKRVWAPQVIYDAKARKYLIYFSMQHGNGPDIIYYVYANKDFTDFEGTPKPLFIPRNKKSCIDGDIVCKDGVYHLYYKTEGDGNGIKMATARNLTSGKWTEHDDYKQQTADAVEGSGIFRLNGSDKYMLMYDVYMNGRYDFCESADLENFSKVDDDRVSMDFHPRHGSVVSLTADEMIRLEKAFSGSGNVNNPVLPEFHADPEVLYSNKTGKYYIYSTTDGQPGWAGSNCRVYSSPDLKDFKDEGVVLELKYGDVHWANGNCWAPAAIEVKRPDGSYRYYLYFSGHHKKNDRKEIGVAVSDDPAGPFVPVQKPVTDGSPTGSGQQIDVDVFNDPVSGKNYIYWGNGYMAGAELNPDMDSFNAGTLTVMTPEGGTLEDFNYREAPYVFCRDGKYYFMWSVDDTGSPNYHVAYGTSDSPLGPIKVADDPVVLIQDPTKGIYGPAHNSVINIPGTDEWKIVYHRINKDYLDRDPGVHREVCIDDLEFFPDGRIAKVVPTK